MANIDELRSRELEELLDWAWKLRASNFPEKMVFSSPGAKTYITDHHRNAGNKFVNISVTGTRCALNCDHCQSSLLGTMEAATTPDELIVLGKKLAARGCEGILISGGADENGAVPLASIIPAIPELKNMGIKILVHSGLASRETARLLKEAGADQVLLDIIGDEETLRKVYHLDRTTQDVEKSLAGLIEEGLEVVPHILIGLNYGKISGEYAALDMITRSGASHIVFVILTPKEGTPMEGISTPSPEEITRLIAIARILNPKARITLGCARPPGSDKILTEKMAVMAGINGMAYALDETVLFAKDKGLAVEFRDVCCSLL